MVKRIATIAVALVFAHAVPCLGQTSDYRGFAPDSLLFDGQPIDAWSLAKSLLALLRSDLSEESDYCDRGRAFLILGNYRGAEMDFSSAIELGGTKPSVYANRGIAYCGTGDYRRGVKDFTVAMDLGLDDAAIYSLRAFAYAQQGRFDKAIMDCGRAIERMPNNCHLYEMRGALYSATGDKDRALTDLNKGLSIGPHSPRLHAIRGALYFDRGSYASAIADLSEAIRGGYSDSPSGYRGLSLAEVFQRRGVSFQYIGKYDEALQDLTKAIELRPGRFAKAHFCRGRVYLLKGEYQLAISDCNGAIRIDNTDAQFFLLRSACYSLCAKHDLALSNTLQAVRLSPNDWFSHLCHGDCYYRKRSYPQAIAEYTLAIQLNPNSIKAYANRASAYRIIGDNQRADEDDLAARRLRQGGL
jgi:tetratricopeptide (TPR) repeat protein